MNIKYFKKLKNKDLLNQVKKLTVLCDKEFIPPLSSRVSTTQKDLKDVNQNNQNDYEYFKKIKNQPILLAIEDNKVIGFMSFIKNYVNEAILDEFQPNIYITTLIVSPYHRRRGIAGKLYRDLINRNIGSHIFTRTWSTNDSHTRILYSLKFHEHKRIKNDRGYGIDTVYYHREPLGMTSWQLLKQYHLDENVFFLSFLIMLTLIFLYVWLTTKNEIVRELSIAFSTSLVASVLCLLSDTLLKYRDSKNDEFLKSLKSFGIENLQFHKDELLERLIPKAKEEIWISGYRLIMTGKKSFRNALVDACNHTEDLKIRILVVPPWNKAYELVYGNEDVSNNYINIFKDLAQCEQENGTNLEIRITNKPLFNDTYKVDDRFITGPYLHCSDELNNKITAKDFFSLDIKDDTKDLYKIIEKDYIAVWEESNQKFNTIKFSNYIGNLINITDLSKEEKFEILQDCIELIN